MLIRRSEVWTRQPQGDETLANIWTGTPLVLFNFSKSPAASNLGSVVSTWTTSANASIVGNFSWSGYKNAASTVGSTYGAADMLGNWSASDQGGFCVCSFIGANFNAQGSSLNTICGIKSTGDFPEWGLVLKADQSLEAYADSVEGTPLVFPGIVAGKKYDVVWGRTPSGLHLLMINGSLVASASKTNSNANSTSIRVFVGGDYANANRAFAGTISLFGVFKGSPASFGTQLSSNLWQIFSPERRTLFVPSGAGTSVYPTTGHGSFAGYSASVAQTDNQSVSPNAAHGTFTGHSPTVTVAANITVSPSAGHGSFTGSQPTVQQTSGQVIAPNAGHGVFAGYSPSIVQPHTVLPGTGSEAFAGYAPTVTITAGQIISPSVVHAVFSGKAPTVIRTDNHSVSPTSGHGLFYGKRPTVSTSSVVYVRSPNGNGSEVIINNTKRQQNISKQLRPANVGGTRH